MHDYGYFEDDHIGQIGDVRLWRRLVGFVLPQWRWVTVAVLLSFLVTAASLAVPRLIQVGIQQRALHARAGDCLGLRGGGRER